MVKLDVYGNPAQVLAALKKLGKDKYHSKAKIGSLLGYSERMGVERGGIMPKLVSLKLVTSKKEGNKGYYKLSSKGYKTWSKIQNIYSKKLSDNFVEV